MIKLGISMEIINLNYQEPNRNRRESKYFWDEMYTLVAAAGFDTIEIPYEPKWDFGGRSGIPLSSRSVNIKFGNIPTYRQVLDDTGIRVAGVHLDPSLFFSPNLDMYFGAFSHFATEAVNFAKEIGAVYVTLTPSPTIYTLQHACPPGSSWASFSDAFLLRTAQVVDELAIFGEQNGVRLCLKNEFWSLLRGDKVIQFLKRLKSKVFWDVDTAHLQIAGTDPLQLIPDNYTLIGCVHLTDTAFTDDQRFYEKPMPEFPSGQATQVFRDPGLGTVEMPAICSFLKTSDYNGSVILNSRQTRDPYRTLLRARSYINAKLSSQL